MNYILYYKVSYYIGISLEVLSYIDYYDPISFPCINLISYLCIVFIKLLFVFYCHVSFFTVPIVILMIYSISVLLDLWNTE